MRRPTAPTLVTLLVVGAVVAFVFVELDPRLLLARTTTTGGDTGAHVAAAAFLRSHLLAHGHLTGWDPQWYDGFPLYTFYFPLPDALAALLSLVMPFDVAFKLATAAGSLSLPVAAWAFGRLAGLERPRPAVLATFTLLFLFDQSFTIYGGNIYSTMAGEYAYSLGLSVALVFLGVVARGLRTGRFRGWAALLLAVCILCHLVAALFAGFGAVVLLLLVGPTRWRVWWTVSSLAVGGLLVAWWAVPFALQQAWTTNMGWVNVHTWVKLFAPGSGTGLASWFSGDRWALWLAAGGAVVAAVRRDRVVACLAILGAGAYVAAVVDPQGKLYNTRFVPLWWLSIYLLAGSAVAELGVVTARLSRQARQARQARQGSGRRPRVRAWAPGAVAVPVAALVLALAVVYVPLNGRLAADVGVAPSSVPSWVRWNYSGYQAKPAYPEYRAVTALAWAGAKRYGCGRTMWEYSSNLDRFGTPMALMLLPMLTNGCVDTQEGLFFESAGSTPFHFVDQSELSAAPSDAMVGLPYGQVDVPLGVDHLRLMGVRYLLASSPQVEAQAAADPELTLIGSTGPWRSPYQGQVVTTTWKLYLVHGASLVTALHDRPEVLTGVGASQPSWLGPALRWYDDPSAWATELVDGGPPAWTKTADRATGRPVPEPPARVSDIVESADRVSFDVDRTGVPVVVKVSYFPAWHAAGAQGPWRAFPNLMVVVPTQHHVTLTYGSTGPGNAGLALTVVGVVALVLLARRRQLPLAR